MRRTRRLVLPVRSWQYVGLLIVSLACLTLGLVSRDREGHAGSLVGPELEHRAPHEVDASPNLNSFAKMISRSITDSAGTTVPIDETRSRVSPTSRGYTLFRSSKLDRSLGIISREARERSFRKQDSKTVERFARMRNRVSDNELVDRQRESRLKTIARSHDIRNAVDSTTRLSRSRSLSDRVTTDRRFAERISLHFNRHLTDRMNYRLENRRSRIAERREINEITRQLNHAERTVNQRMSDHRDLRSLSMERRIPDEMNRWESRDVSSGRREIRDTAQRLVDQRFDIRERRSIKRRVTERRNTDRSIHREDRKTPLERATKVVQQDIDRDDIYRARELSLDTRRALFDRVVASRERRSRFLADIQNSRKDLIRFNDRRALSRSMERLRVNDLAREISSRRAKSVELNRERFSDRRLPAERRSSARSLARRETNRAERRQIVSSLSDRKFFDRIPSEDLRQAKVDRSQRIMNVRESRGNAASKERSEDVSTRNARSRSEIASLERREKIARASRIINRQEISRNSRDHERIDSFAPRANLNSARLDSRKSFERRIDENSRLRETSRIAERHLDRSSERRASRERILKKQYAFALQRSAERKSNESSRIRQESKMTDRLERISELANSILMRMTKRRMNSKLSTIRRDVLPTSERRSDERRDLGVIRNFSERRVARSMKNRLTEYSQMEFIKQTRERQSNNEDSSRVASLRRVIRLSRAVPEQNREQKLVTNRISPKLVDREQPSAQSERDLQHTRDKNVEVEMKMISDSMKSDEFLKYPAVYFFIKQAVVIALCTIYGLSLYNGKTSFIRNNVAWQVQRFMMW